MAINFPENYRKTLVEGFNNAAQTNDLFGHQLDAEFSGVRTVHIPNLIAEPLQDYNRNANINNASRYGDTKEVQDAVQTFEMTQDKSLSLTVDKGNNKEQFDMKKVGAIMKEERERYIVPELDTYRLKKWADGAGIRVELPALSKTNIGEQIITVHNTMRDKGVPDDVVLLISRKYLPTLKLSHEWINTNDLAKETLAKGYIKEFDGMMVKPITSARMPANVAFMLVHKTAIIAPMKIQEFKGHIDPPGLSGNLIEFRMIHDAFVIGQKADGVAIGVEHGKLAADPTYSGTATVTIASTDGDTFYYTTDGSDPRFSDSVQTGSSVPLEVGQTLKAYCTMSGKFASNVTTHVRTE